MAELNFILPLAAPAATLENAGGKGLSLSKMLNAGLPVPDGFLITTDAYRQFVAENGLQEKILTALLDADALDAASLETASAAIGTSFANSKIPNAVAHAVACAYAQLDGGAAQTENQKAVAVRSSATAEDLPGASFAGQQETYLNLRGERALLDAVKKCWASLWTARAIAYRMKNDIDPNSVALAVVVQEMVNAQAAGILFTANPLNGARDEMVINAAWGLGEAIVGGLVSPDTMVADKATGKLKTVEVAEKTVVTVPTETGTRELALTDARRTSQVLNAAQVVELAGIARRIEALYGVPQDIEWCLTPSRNGTGGTFLVVQSRPITALPPEPVRWPVPRRGLMMARGSLAEHLPNAVSPLFGTLGLRSINQATLELSDIMGGLDLKAAEYQYRVINGYVYFGFLMSAKFMWAMVKVTVTSLNLMFKRSRERWLEAREIFSRRIADWDVKEAEKLTPSELLEGARALIYAAGKYYTVIQSSTLPSASSSEIGFTNVYKLMRRKEDPKPETMLFGLDTVALRAEKSLFDLGMWIRERPALREWTLGIPTEEQVAAIRADAPPAGIPAAEWSEFKARLEKHAGAFGHTAYEFDFMNPTPAETPQVILDSVKMYVEGKGSDPYARQREVTETRDRTLHNIRNRFHVIPYRWFDKVLQWAIKTTPAREDSIADMGMGHTAIRRMLGELGKRFAAQGAIADSKEIYWLAEDEVVELAAQLERNETLPDYSAVVRARQAEWREQMKLIPPAILPEKSRWSKLIPWSQQNAGGSVIKGLGASPGRVTATARVLFTPEDFNRMQPGDVLVAVITTPAWTPLFTLASAIVTDIGGPLSHSSIVAREYGIPAVLATGGGTRRIRDGQTITVDGSRGTVTLG